MGYEVYRGDGQPFEATVTVEGVADPLSGSRFWFTIKKDLANPDSEAVIQKSYPGSGISGSVEHGVATYRWKIAAEDTLDLPDALLDVPLHWDTKYVGAGPEADPQTIRKGTIRIKAGVTRATR